MDRTLSIAAPTATDRSAHAVGLAEWLSRRAARAPPPPARGWGGAPGDDGPRLARHPRQWAVLAAGARVGYLGLNDPMFVVVLFATARIGAICVPLNFRLSGAELSFAINDAGGP
ncbi:AMP-binding protein [Variovorax sp. Varisp85]|uniref:AMP-binding protein n=1 Tax=Variovorax sp. Varisp85 TaxID=3243059 RepID=UPI0039A56060